jgi:uncharacterized protein YdeI (YjbR/CyaY-like superfamily)
MKIGKTLYVIRRDEWRKWLKENYDKESEVWLLLPKKSTGKKKINYNDSVEEALCFGWIDSIQKTVDENSTAQRYSPRKPKTPYSQTNIERLREMVKEKKIIKPVLDSLGDLLDKKFVIPQDILESIKASKKAWTNFQKFSDAYIRIRIAFIDASRKRPEEFKKRLNYFIRKTEENKSFGYGGVEKYF